MAFSQSRLQQFLKLSPPVRCWVMGHLQAAPKVLRISNRALTLTDSMRQSPDLDADFNGGTLDAFRHGIWMAMLVQAIPEKQARRLGEAYERGNYRDFKRGKLEEGQLPDAASSEMDLHNNAVGRQLGLALGPSSSGSALVQAVIQAIQAGQFRIIRKDRQGRSLDARGNPVDLAARHRQWNTARTLVPSNTLRD